MADDAAKYLVIGLPASGKTTFLAALWHVLDSEEVAGSLRLQQLHGDREHVNNIRDSWLKCEGIERTGIGSEALVSMRLREVDGSDLAEVVFQDSSGESYRQQWEERRWTPEYDQLARNAQGALLFLHPDKAFPPARIADANRVLREAGKNAPQTDDEGTEEWHPKSAPRQVKIVDLLQFLEGKDYVQKPFRTAVVISAWDLVQDEGFTPQEWLCRRLPLLGQYFRSKRHMLPSRVYGISAQGGDLATDADCLRGFMVQSERIAVIGEGASAHDITEPIRWLMA